MTSPTKEQLRVPSEIKLYIDARYQEQERQLQHLHQGINHKLAALKALEADLENRVAECQAKVAKMEDKLATDPAYKITKSLLIKVAKELENTPNGND